MKILYIEVHSNYIHGMLTDENPANYPKFVAYLNLLGYQCDSWENHRRTTPYFSLGWGEEHVSSAWKDKRIPLSSYSKSTKVRLHIWEEMSEEDFKQIVEQYNNIFEDNNKNNEIQGMSESKQSS